MARFDDCLAFVLAREGGFVDDPVDRGRATNQGVTQRSYDAYRVHKGLPQQSVKFMLSSERDEIYQTTYWAPVGGDVILQPLDACMFDAAVNHGPSRAIGFLQDIAQVPNTSTLDAATMVAIADKDQAVLAGLHCDRRWSFYKAIVARDATQARFINGWRNRLYALRTFCRLDTKTYT
jgi:lysozyme family protein